MSRSVLGALAAALLLVLSTSSDANAQARIGVHAGLNMENTDLFLGANSQFGMEVGERDIWGNVGLEIYPFTDGFFLTRINVNGLLPLVSATGAEIYGGGGIVIGLTNFDSDELENDTDFGINAVAGVILSGDEKNFRPFLELNQTIGAGTDFSVRAGVFFKLNK